MLAAALPAQAQRLGAATPRAQRSEMTASMAAALPTPRIRGSVAKPTRVRPARAMPIWPPVLARHVGIVPRPRVCGYARVSSREQNLDRQLAALAEFGVAESGVSAGK